MSSRSNICTWRVLYRRQPFGNPEHSGLFFPTKNIGKTRGFLSRTEESLGTGHTLPHGAAGARGQAPKTGRGAASRSVLLPLEGLQLITAAQTSVQTRLSV